MYISSIVVGFPEIYTETQKTYCKVHGHGSHRAGLTVIRLGWNGQGITT